MGKSYLRGDISADVYHGVPAGWRAEDIRREHAKLEGTYDLKGPDATEPGAPSFMIHRHDWLQYRETLYRVADGVKAGDPACVEIAVRFIELRHIGSYSGYVRSRLARRLKSSAILSYWQKRRLHDHFSDLAIAQTAIYEFADYIRLWRRCITQRQLDDLLSDIRNLPDGEVRAERLSSKLWVAP